MPGQCVTTADVARRAAASFVATDRVRMGAEVEWLVYHRTDPTRPVTAPETAAIASGTLPSGSTVTIEPGGQVELVTAPASDPASLIDSIESDTAVLARRFAEHDLLLVPLGLDPIRSPRRTLDRPRYEAMARYFAEVSPAGLHMMSLTASLQLNIDFGPDPATTWEHAHALAPVLAAAFANSPTTDGSQFRPVSHRLRVWAWTDPSRTRPVGARTEDWLPYLLNARVMLREGAGGIERFPGSRSFGEWLADDEPPSADDLALHVTTLFPPLRPRGYLELRMIDAVPAAGRAAAIAAVWTLLTDARAGDEAMAACRMLPDPWALATAEGLENDDMRGAATALLDIAAASSARAWGRHLAQACEACRDRLRSGVGAGTVEELFAGAEATAATHR